MWPSCWKLRDRALRRVDRDVREVRAAEPLQLRVEVREVPPLQQRVVAEVDARHDVLRAEGDLLGLGEEVVDAPVEHQPADRADRHLLLGDDLGRVEDVERELLGERVVEELHARAPTRGSRRPAMASHRSRRWKSGSAPLILTASFQTTDCRPCFGFQWNLTKVDLPCGVDQPEGVDAEALHEAERPRDRPVGHDPHDHVHALGRERDEVPDVVVGGRRLREAAVRLLLEGVDHVGELDRVLDEEDRDVVADEVPVALLGVELDGEAADVAGQVGRALVAGDGREADERRRLLALALEEVGPGDVGERAVVLEVAVDAEAAGVDDALGDALVVEVEDLLAEVEVFQQAPGRGGRPGACSGRRRRGRPAGWSAPGRCRRRLVRLAAGPGVAGRRGVVRRGHGVLPDNGGGTSRAGQCKPRTAAVSCAR